MRIPRPAVAALAGIVAVAVVGCGTSDGDDRAGPDRAATSSASTPAGGDGSPSGRRGELTTGPLMPASNPVSVTITALKVTSVLTGLGLTSDGTMQVPDDAATVGWFTRAPTPGALGPAVLAGHVNWKGRDGAFAALHTLTADAEIDVARADGTTAVFTVTKVERYPKDRFPSDAVYGAIDHAGLRLITCGGEFDASRNSYRDNIVVFAMLARST
jgi:hypothetical protein